MTDTTLVVLVNGQNYTDRFAPVLHSVSISKSRKAESDTADIVVDDTEGALRLPPQGAAIDILIGRKGGAPVRRFRGKTDEPKAAIDRGGGRLVRIHAKATDMNGPQKERKTKDWVDKPLGDILAEAAELVGTKITVHPALKAVKVAYEAMDGESFLAFGRRLAQEFGATFKVELDRAAFVPRNLGQTATGTPIPLVTIAAGDNLHSADITPVIGRALYQGHETRWFDRAAAEWKVEAKASNGPLTLKAKAGVRITTQGRATKEEAAAQSEASATQQESEAGKGTIDCDGDERLMPEGIVELVGHRAGCDGTYVIDSMSEQVDRSGSWTASLSVEKPGGGAGEDKR